ncbi:aspartate aminotransferase [Roseovarius nitratireducens]|uniref:aspartate aminotransferase n=1 Tax=Roseovarius nitratireducens TaxID=2044597 RepID=UPI000CE27FCB
MQNRNSPLSPEVWLHDLFTSKAVQQGTVIRRKARDIERFAGMDLFLREIDRRGYRVIENSGQIIIFCNRAPIRWLTPGAPPISSKEIGPKSFQDFGRSTTV